MGPILACDCPEYSTNITLLGQHEIVFLQTMPRCHAGVSRAQGLIPVGRLDAASLFERMLDLSCMDMTKAVPVNLWVRKSPGPRTYLPFPGIPLFGKPCHLLPDTQIFQFSEPRLPTKGSTTPCR